MVYYETELFHKQKKETDLMQFAKTIASTLCAVMCAIGLAAPAAANPHALTGAEDTVSNHYLRVGALTGLYRDLSFIHGQDSKVELDTVSLGEFSNIGFQAGYGYRVSDFFRLEGNAEYHDRIQMSGGSGDEKFASEVEAASFLVWGLMDTPDMASPFGKTLQMFGGVGVGASRLSLKESTFEAGGNRFTLPVGEKYNVAYGLTAGISQAMSDRIALDIGYRYMNYGEMRPGKGTPRGAVAASGGRPSVRGEGELRGSEALIALRFGL